MAMMMTKLMTMVIMIRKDPLIWNSNGQGLVDIFLSMKMFLSQKSELRLLSFHENFMEKTLRSKTEVVRFLLVGVL